MEFLEPIYLCIECYMCIVHFLCYIYVIKTGIDVNEDEWDFSRNGALLVFFFPQRDMMRFPTMSTPHTISLHICSHSLRIRGTCNI